MADFLDDIQTERGDAEWQRLAGYMSDIQDGARSVWTIQQDDRISGMVTVRWQSDYKGFRGMPEIIDLYIWQDERRRGLATQLMQHVEQDLRARDFAHVGLSVGLLPEDAPAWHFYFQRGYQFDGTGAWWQGQNVTSLSVIDLSADPVLLMMVKNL